MSVRLLDVNILISLLDSAHQHHRPAVEWFHTVAVKTGWASTPLTENGFIRIISQPTYPNLRITPAAAAQNLNRFRSAFAGVHRFWPDDVSLTDSALFDLSHLTGAKQTTDAYLAGLAFRKKGRLTTLDHGVVWRAVCGATAALVETIIPRPD
jgi:toxin-antitoxin system PIN domain toxin